MSRLAGGGSRGGGSHDRGLCNHFLLPTSSTCVPSRAHSSRPQLQGRSVIPTPPYLGTPFVLAADLRSTPTRCELEPHFRNDRFSSIDGRPVCDPMVVAVMTAAAAGVAALAAHCGTQGEVDLHGLTVMEALAVVDNLLSSSGLGQRFRTGGSLTLITGKGRHSGPAGPQLLVTVRHRLNHWGAVFTDIGAGFVVSFDGEALGRQCLAAETMRWSLDRRLFFAQSKGTSSGSRQPERSASLLGESAKAQAEPPALALPPMVVTNAASRFLHQQASPRAGMWLLTLVVGNGGASLWVTSPSRVRSLWLSSSQGSSHPGC